MDISVIISTYNRSEILKNTLKTLLKVKDGGMRYEIIIVDNNSKDDTKKTVESYAPRFTQGLKYLFEKRQGKSYALNLGIEKAEGNVLAFIDDDILLDENWLLNVWKCFKNNNCDAVGGRVLPIYPEKTPKWVEENIRILQGPIALYDYGESVKIYDNREMPPFVGANMAIRRNCFKEIGLFRTDLGPGLVNGEDSELFTRLIRHNKICYYCGEALVWHKMDIKSVSLFFIARWYVEYGKYCMIRETGEIPRDVICYFGIPRYLIRKVLKNISDLIFCICNRREFLKMWFALWCNIGKIVKCKASNGCSY